MRHVQQMGVTKRTLYSHFGSKEGLIEAVLEYRHQQFMAQLRAALQHKESAQIPQAYLDFIEDWTTSNDFYGCLFINACAEYGNINTTPHQIAAQHKKSIRDLLTEKLSPAKADMLFLLGEGLIIAAQTGQILDKEL